MRWGSIERAALEAAFDVVRLILTDGCCEFSTITAAMATWSRAQSGMPVLMSMLARK